MEASAGHNSGAVSGTILTWGGERAAACERSHESHFGNIKHLQSQYGVIFRGHSEVHKEDKSFIAKLI